MAHACPFCSSRATKILHLSTGMTECQICGREYQRTKENIVISPHAKEPQQ